MKIQILGTGCAKCKALMMATEKAAQALGLTYELEKVTDLRQIMAFGVMTTPALVVDGQVKVSGKVPSVDELKMIMRGIYYQYAKNLPFGIPDQVAELNQLVVNWSAPHILSAVDHYHYYLKDISTLPVPMAQPKNLSRAGSKSLPFNQFV
jgi:small redox-active disulfide protein 2